MKAQLCDPRICELGEGPFWHPLRQELFWFDILGQSLLSRREGEGAGAPAQVTQRALDGMYSAAGWIDADTLLLASEHGLWRFPLGHGTPDMLVGIEDDRPGTRSNDGRADPLGGFWIGTMGKRAEPGAGAIYRWYRGELRRLFGGLSIPNAICFAPDGQSACFADTPGKRILRVALDRDGWPAGAPECFVDLGPEGLFPDGAVFDASGGLWNAQWGAGRVARYHPDGSFDRAVTVAGLHSSCPCFGGPDLGVLYITTAREGLVQPGAGQGALYSAVPGVAGLPAPQVLP